MHPFRCFTRRVVLLFLLATFVVSKTERLHARTAAQPQPDAEVIEVDAKAPSHPFPHFWEKMFGSGRAILSLRESYRHDLRETKRITNFAIPTRSTRSGTSKMSHRRKTGPSGTSSSRRSRATWSSATAKPKSLIGISKYGMSRTSISGLAIPKSPPITSYTITLPAPSSMSARVCVSADHPQRKPPGPTAF